MLDLQANARIAIMAALLFACEGEPVQSPGGADSAPDVAMALDVGVDARPVDAASVDAAFDSSMAPIPVELGPWPVRVLEGHPSTWTLQLTPAADGPVRISSPVLSMVPADIVLDPSGVDRVDVQLEAPVDADENSNRISLTVESGPHRWTLPVPVIDAHHTVELIMTPEQVAGVRAERERSTRYDVGTRIDGRDGPDAEINLRGKGTFFCRRRSFTVRFDAPVYIGDSPPLDHVVLLSMCEDEPYLRMHAAARVLRSVGLSFPWSTYAELRYGDGTRGVYLLVERPRKAAARLDADNALVIRRLRDDTEEIKVPDEDDIADREAVLAPYRALFRLAESLQGQALLDQLHQRMDYGHYLDWLAVNSALENGDYIDEVYFFDRNGPPGSASPYFSIIPWDYDGVQTRCHVGNFIREPLLYCAESALDRPVNADPVVRAAFIERMSALLDGPLAPDAFEAIVRRSARELAVYLDRDGVREIMARESGPLDPAVAADAMSARYRERVDAIRAVMAEEVP